MRVSAARRRPALRRLGCALALAGFAACSAEVPDREMPLVDGLHAPDVLTEADRLERPPTDGGNRFLTGWIPWVHDGEHLLAATTGRARVELVHLAPRPRRLLLDGVAVEHPRGAALQLAVAGEPVGEWPLAAGLEVSRPASLPIGRVPIDLAVGGGARLDLREIRVLDALPPGQVSFGRDGLRQSGDSVVDFVRRLDRGATLLGTFRPPGAPTEGQRFELWLEPDGRPARRLFAWSPGLLARFRGERPLYAGAVAYNDALLGELVEELAKRYPPEETLVVLTSDHGEELFDHGGVLHGYQLYDEMLRIPAVLWWPGRIGPRRIETPTDTQDLHATLGALVETPADAAGRSLWPWIDGSAGAADRDVQFAAASSLEGGIFMARSGRRKLVWAPRQGTGWGMGAGLGMTHDPEYLFDLENDAAETVNRAGDRSLEADWLRARLRAWIQRTRIEEAGGLPPALDEETRARLRALGYLR